MSKIAYLRKSAALQFTRSRFNCPNCGSVKSSIVEWKYLITQLRRCENCKLMFRTPIDDPSDNQSFYENEYAQGFTTDVPSDVDLASLIQTNFTFTEKDYSYYISVLRQIGLGAGAKVFDYGCSWGYGSYQMAKAEFEVISFEVAPSRRRYAREKLGVNTVASMDEAVNRYAGQFDCFFSSHVIEHVPSPTQTFRCALQLLKLNGLFVSFTPNGCLEYKAKSPEWSKLWGEVHPNFIDGIFLDHNFHRSPRTLGSTPVMNAQIGDDLQMKRLNGLDGFELFFAARKIGDSWD